MSGNLNSNNIENDELNLKTEDRNYKEDSFREMGKEIFR